MFFGAERNGLRQYLQRGGILFAEACCGHEAFDQAFRRELAAALGGATLQPLPATHPIFQYTTQSALFSRALPSPSAWA